MEWNDRAVPQAKCSAVGCWEVRNRGLGIKCAGMGEVRRAGGRKSRVGSVGMRGFDYL